MAAPEILTLMAVLTVTALPTLLSFLAGLTVLTEMEEQIVMAVLTEVAVPTVMASSPIYILTIFSLILKST